MSGVKLDTMPLRSVGDVVEEPFLDVLRAAHAVADLTLAVKTAFVTEHYQELRGENQRPLDAVDDDDGPEAVPARVTKTIEEVDAYEREQLEELPLPGTPISEADRKREWLKLPRNARLATRRMHNEWGHKPKSVLKAILKASKAPKEYIDAVDDLRCEACEITSTNPQTKKSAPPKPASSIMM